MTDFSNPTGYGRALALTFLLQFGPSQDLCRARACPACSG
jgi:hypothetical protein